MELHRYILLSCALVLGFTVVLATLLLPDRRPEIVRAEELDMYSCDELNAGEILQIHETGDLIQCSDYDWVEYGK